MQAKSIGSLAVVVSTIAVAAVSCGGSDAATAPVGDASAPPLGLGADGGDAASVTVALPQAPSGQPITATPREQWAWIPIDGAKCLDGSKTGIGVNFTSKTKKLLIVLEGGGACFDDVTCNVGTINKNGFGKGEFDAEIAAMGYTGILSRTNPYNPFTDYNFVFVPYCTGDIHGGSNPGDAKGRYFVGYDNLGHVLDRVVPTFPAAEKVVLAGSSAGGFGAAYNYDRVSRAFGAVPVHLLDDSGPVLPPADLKPCLVQKMTATWRLDKTLPPDCTDCQKADGTGFWGLPRFLAKKYPAVRGGIVSGTHDAVIRTFFGEGYSSDCQSPGMVPANDYAQGLTDLENALTPFPNFHVFYVDSASHTWLLTDTLGFVKTGDTTLADWLSNFESGDSAWKNGAP